MWDVYVVDEVGVFKANSQPLNIIEAELLAKHLKDLVIFLFPTSRDLPVGFSRLRSDIDVIGST